MLAYCHINLPNYCNSWQESEEAFTAQLLTFNLSLFALHKH